MPRRVTAAALLLTACLAPAAAEAACSAAVTPVSFGTYVPLSATARDSTGSVTVTCTAQSGSIAVALNAGLHAAGGFTGRAMTGGASRLSYQLYTNAARSSVWGDGTGGSSQVTLPRAGTATIYGRIPARQPVGAGSYADTVVITLIF